MPIDFQTFGSIGQGFGRVGTFRRGVLGWPVWARYLLMVPMIPGILLLALCLVGFLVSLLALFVLTAPVYAVLSRVFNQPKSGDFVSRNDPSPGSKRVEAVVRDV